MQTITMKCGTVITLKELDISKISYVPCNEEKPLLKFASFLDKRQHTGKAAYDKKWNAYTTRDMTGVQLMCGKPTYRRIGRTDYLYYTSIDIEARLVTGYPEVTEQIRTIYHDACEGIPCEIQTKSGGLRLDAYTPYCGKKWAFKDDDGMLLEVLANKSLARIDHRYTMLEGSLLEMPTLPKEALREIHGLISDIATTETADDKPREVVERSQIGDLDIEWGSDGRSQLFPTRYCQNEPHTSNRYEVRFTKHSTGSVDGKCFNCGKTWWEIPPRDRGPIRLRKSKLECVLEVLDRTRERIADAFSRGKKFIGLRADTGTGKTEQAIKYLLKGYKGFFSVPTTELAKDVFNRFTEAEIRVFRWRGLGSEPDGQFPHEKPCMFPDEYKVLAESGRNAYKLLCQDCPYLTECETDGFRSQEEKAKKHDVIVAAHPDLVNNPTFRHVAARLLPGRKDDLIIIDEHDPLQAFNEINVPKSRLEYLRDTWHDHELGDFAKDILHAIAVENKPFAFIRGAVEHLTQRNVRDEIITALGSLRIGDVIMDTDAAHNYELRNHLLKDLKSIKHRPKLESEDWNLLVQLELFFQAYRHTETAPMFYKDDTLTFYVRPLPLYTQSCVILMSATLVEAFFRLVYSIRQDKRGDVDFIDAVNTEWHPKAIVYQLRRNRNPRRTLLQGEKDDKGKWQYTSKLSDTGKKYLKRITESIKAQPHKKHGFIAHKAIIKHHTNELQEAGVVCEHFGNLVGLDTKFKGVDVLHILGAPNVGQEAIETAAKMLFGLTDAPLDFTRNEDGSYADANVQAVADAIVKSELIQAIGRARLVRNPASLVLWCSLELPSVTHRKQTILFDPADWDNAHGNLDALPAVIASRVAQEAREQEAVDAGDVQAYAKAAGQSERTARRHTEQQRKQSKAERNAEIHRRYTELEQTQQEIADALGIGLATVNRVLKS